MIKIENVEVYGWEPAIRGMHNPTNSWSKSDSNYHRKYDYDDEEYKYEYIIGNNDLALMEKLVKTGPDYSKFMQMINVTLDIIAPLYWWEEFDTYDDTIRNSCDILNSIIEKELTIDDFSWEHLLLISDNQLQSTIDAINLFADEYLKRRSKSDLWQILQLLPASYNQRATVQLNYEVLRQMYHIRKNHHNNDEWAEFCKWIETLPYNRELIM